MPKHTRKNPLDDEWSIPILAAGFAVGAVVFLHAKNANATLVDMSTPNFSAPPVLAADGKETGTSILHRTTGLSQANREREFIRLALADNSPSWMWNPVPVDSTLSVTPDFLSLGTDGDYIWIPLTPEGAQQVLSAHRMRFPTRAEADAIYAAALANGNKVNFQSWSPRTGQSRWGNTALSDTRTRTLAAIRGRTGLIDGHKKYVLGETRGKVIIYGAYDAAGSRIQPYSTVHDASYLDYSHGIRGVAIKDD